mmetsp:Transcript_8248/g.15933  ORF Transcript_8248/g.15933 Transcript_8248/m.15933 type:complete len:96 (+) Transcript_8248:149-436(+)|eukprot:CAMPEP_0174309476 /NCGR_PEP_ID=MMETSP0810-20121108/2436_1 /TAXON_ID=73025 ORGANISM="Eutreptiella gymnastica-like, Strain CCMP1594" /NCGR_SAMPLE_ID=MMETSP0810 /ASSEMBLY_ACC=CAM_ASM_000659 /LENGTH=95 /DNA_ID=CAMNT_0015417123 /DNA_START=519 /DNA_END=806 /DNA_ORIENTATION=+
MDLTALCWFLTALGVAGHQDGSLEGLQSSLYEAFGQVGKTVGWPIMEQTFDAGVLPENRPAQLFICISAAALDQDVVALAGVYSWTNPRQSSALR